MPGGSGKTVPAGIGMRRIGMRRLPIRNSQFAIRNSHIRLFSEELFLTTPREYVHSNFGGEVQPADIAPYLLLPTDAGQVEKIVARWDTARRVTHHYEYLIYTGQYGGLPVSACSTGLGGMSVSIAVEELAKLGARTFLHVGIADPLADDATPGDLIIATGAARFDGTSHDYARPEFPALAHFELVMAAIAAAEQAGALYHVGPVASLASSGPRPTGRFAHFLTEQTAPLRQAMRQAGLFGGSGEEATLLVQAALYGFRAGAVVVRPPDQAPPAFDPTLDETALAVGLDALRMLWAWDQAAERRHLAHIVPTPIDNHE